MASYPPAACCTVGVKHEGEAMGEMTTIGESKLGQKKDIHANAQSVKSSVCLHFLSKGQVHRIRYSCNSRRDWQRIHKCATVRTAPSNVISIENANIPMPVLLTNSL